MSRELLLVVVVLAVALFAVMPAFAGGIDTANGWYEGEEIYYAALGVQEGVTERGENDIYLIGGDREWQAQVVEFIPGEAGYSPHWNAHFVSTAPGVTVADIVASEFVSEHYPEALIDDVEDVKIHHQGVEWNAGIAAVGIGVGDAASGAL